MIWIKRKKGRWANRENVIGQLVKLHTACLGMFKTC
jgi:hypothetical protein